MPLLHTEPVESRLPIKVDLTFCLTVAGEEPQLDQLRVC